MSRPIPEWVDPAEIRLPPIPASDLEHIEDPKLDDAYENKLKLTGDDLGPIRAISGLLDELFSFSRPAHARSNGSGPAAAAAAPALDVASVRPPIDDEPVEIPTLSDNPTEEELRQYAEAHPIVRIAKRVFRGKVVAVKRT